LDSDAQNDTDGEKVKMPITPLTTLDNVKEWVGVQPDNTTDDELLTRLLNAVSQLVVGYCDRLLLTASYTEQYSRHHGHELTPQNWPISAVASLTVNGNSIPASPDGIQDGFVFNDTTIFLMGYSFGYAQYTWGTQARYLNVTVNYTAGYQTIPYDLEQAVIHLIALRYKERERIGQRSKSMAGEVVSFSVFDIPPDVAMILNMYKRIVS
jgi:hypothetical protein